MNQPLTTFADDLRAARHDALFALDCEALEWDALVENDFEPAAILDELLEFTREVQGVDNAEDARDLTRTATWSELSTYARAAVSRLADLLEWEAGR